MKMIYLCSPYSHSDKFVQDQREAEINLIAAKLQAKYKVVIFPPILISAVYKRLLPDKFGTTFKYWCKVDLAAIKHCDEVWVAMMDGYKESIGVTAEIAYAEETNKPVKYIDTTKLKLREFAE